MNKPQDLRTRILKCLKHPAYQPMDKVQLSKKLGLSSDDRRNIREILKQMEQAGEIARIRKDRYVIPKEANLFTGVLQVHAGGNAHLISAKKGEPDLFISSDNMGTALNGDTVVARLVHEGVEDRQRRSTGRAQEGRVIRILKRAHETIVGTLQKTKNFFYVVPDDPRFPKDVYVHPGETQLSRPPNVGEKVVVKLDPWESRHINPEGEVVEVLGPASAPGVDVLSIIRKYSLPTDFPPAVLKEADQIAPTVSEKEAAEREDLRGRLIFTIDPDDAKDFDDAIEVEATGDGWRLGVHIADVSHYVKPGSVLDTEARHRGNSVYLVDRVVPMLPERLSNGICSLKPKVDRLTHSVFVDFNAAGKIKKVRFAATVIHSAARYTYKEAFAILQRTPKNALEKHMHTAWDLASVLRKNRFKEGSLDLDFPEIKVRLDENGVPVKLEKIEYDISHQLIEEFMLVANEVVAKATKDRLFPSVYRIHEDPEPEKLAEYREMLKSYGIRVGDLTQKREVQRLLKLIRGSNEEYALKLGLLKSLKRATYDVNPLGHYGLAKTNYTHFTSPIRRYADLIVHRVLSQVSRKQRQDKRIKDLAEVADHISVTERTAADAEKESVKMKKIEFFQNQIKAGRPEAFPAVIIDVKSYGLLVELPDFLLTGLIHVSSLSDDFYLFDPVKLQFVGRRKKKVYRIGERLAVVVARVDTFKQQVDFHPVED